MWALAGAAASTAKNPAQSREAVRPAQQMVIQGSGARRIERCHHRGDVRLGPGSCLFAPAGLKHTTAAGDDAECLLI